MSINITLFLEGNIAAYVIETLNEWRSQKHCVHMWCSAGKHHWHYFKNWNGLPTLVAKQEKNIQILINFPMNGFDQILTSNTALIRITKYPKSIVQHYIFINCLVQLLSCLEQKFTNNRPNAFLIYLCYSIFAQQNNTPYTKLAPWLRHLRLVSQKNEWGRHFTGNSS